MKRLMGKGRKLVLWGLVISLCVGSLSGCGSKAASSDTMEATSADSTMASSAAPADSGISQEPSITFDKAVERDTRKEKIVQQQDSKEYPDTYFRDYGVNPFVQTGEQPLSTFSMDVDTASYTIARKYINDGSLPPQDAIRPEEFVNYFKRQYPQPTNSTFSIYTEMAPSAFNRGYHVLEVGLQGKNVGTAEMKNSALTFVIDVSGSMDMDNRLTLVKKSLKILVDQMGENDKIGIVVYGTTGRKLLEPTNGSNKNRIMDSINELKPEGSTNAAEGLMLGYEMASEANIKGGNNRIILCTDGVANQGITKAEDILKMVEDYKSKGITLTTLGFGMDNYNDIFLETLADKGDGNYSYIDTIDEAKKVFINQLTGTLQVIAKDAKSQIEFNTDSVESYRLIGYENRKLDAKDFRNNSVDAGEVGAGHAVTALYEIKLKSSVSDNIGTVRIRFKDPDTNRVSEESKQIKASQIWSSFYDATPRFRFITMVAQTAEILKGSPWASNTDLQDVYDIIKNNIKDLQMNNEDDQFVDMVKKAIAIKAR